MNVPGALDFFKFADEDFDADVFIKESLPSNSEEAIEEFKQSVIQFRTSAVADLQKTVYKNYKEFSKITKEISSLESDMNTLKGLLGELKGVQGLVKTLMPAEEFEPDTPLMNKAIGGFFPDDKAAVVAPVLLEDAYGKSYPTQKELNIARYKQMAELYETVEGLQKLLPTSTSRHMKIDGKASKFVEIPQANVKMTTTLNQTVSLYLFNDSIAVIYKKKALIGGKSKLVLDKLFMWHETAIIDVKDAEHKNTIKVMRYPDTFLFKTEVADDKRIFMNNVKIIMDGLALDKKKEQQVSEQKNLDSTFSMDDIDEDVEVDVDEDELGSGALGSQEMLRQAEFKSIVIPEKEHRYVNDLADELDVLIAYRDFENAVLYVEKGQKIFSMFPGALPECEEAVERRISKLANLISLQLANPDLHRNQVKWNIDILLKLGLGEQARDIFLTARTMTIRHRIRQLKFNGDVSSYISDLSNIIFRLIRNTCDWYGANFREAYMASGFIKWVQCEIENYAQIFRRQVFDSKQDFVTISSCLEHTMMHCNQLREVGLDLSFVLDKLFYQDLIAAIDKHANRCSDVITKNIGRDSFGAMSVPSMRDNVKVIWGVMFGESKIRMSQCVYDFFSLLVDFGDDIQHLISIPLYVRIVTCLKDFFTVFMNKLLDMFSKDWSNRQYFVMMVNANFVVDEMMPTLTKNWSDKLFMRSIPELEDHRTRMKATLITLSNAFVRLASVKLISKDYNFLSLDYTSSAAILDTAKPSEAMLKLISELHMICLEIDPSLNKSKIVTDIIQKLFDFMSEPRCWENEKGPRKFGYGGVQQVVLDIHLLLRIAEEYISEHSNLKANTVCEKALRLYFSQNKDMKVALKSGDWYDRRVEDLMKTISKNYHALLPGGGVQVVSS